MEGNTKNKLTRFDKWLQKQRIKRALPFIKLGDTVLDIGCWDLKTYETIKPYINYYIGIEPLLKNSFMTKGEIRNGFFPDNAPLKKVDKILALAVFEHILESERLTFIKACYQCLKNEGKIILTIPDRKADYILDIITKFPISEGMELEQHQHFDINQTVPLFEQIGFKLHKHYKFQFGLNNLFVFQKMEGKI